MIWISLIDFPLSRSRSNSFLRACASLRERLIDWLEFFSVDISLDKSLFCDSESFCFVFGFHCSRVVYLSC